MMLSKDLLDQLPWQPELLQLPTVVEKFSPVKTKILLRRKRFSLLTPHNCTIVNHPRSYKNHYAVLSVRTPLVGLLVFVIVHVL